MRSRSIIAAGLLAAVVTPGAFANDEAESLRNRLAETHPDFTVDAVHSTPVDGIYEVVSGTNVIYITADGRHVFRGELLDLEAERNLTAERKAKFAHRTVGNLGEENMVVYEPAEGDAEYMMTVFTDTTCGYCRQLHEEMIEVIDSHSIKLRYVMYPRAGVDSPAADTLRDVWCADDPREAMTLAKRGKRVAGREPDCDPPVDEQFEAGRSIGISGTPYILLNEDGPAFSGYRPREQLLSMLEASRDSL